MGNEIYEYLDPCRLRKEERQDLGVDGGEGRE